MKLLVILLLCLIASQASVLRWTRYTPTGTVPTNITNAAVEFDGDHSIYSIGGHRELWLSTGVDITFFDHVFKLDLTTHEWSLVDVEGSKPSPRAYASYVRSNTGKIYVHGGTTFLNDYSITNIFSDLWEFDTDTETFTLITTTNVGPGNRSTSELFLHNNVLYVTAGISGLDEFGIPIYANDIWSLNLAASPKTWQFITTTISPPPRGSFFKFQKGDKLYIAGGEVLDLMTFQFLTLEDTWVFDISSGTWTDITPSSSDNIDPPRSYVSSFPFGLTNWLVYGGEIPGPITGCYSPFPANVIDDTWIYNIITNEWHEIYPGGDHPPNLKRHAGVQTNVYVAYYIAGWSFYCTPTDQRGQIFNNDIYKLSIGWH